MSNLPEYSSVKDTRPRRLRVGMPGFFRSLANNRNNIELEEAKKRIRKNLHGQIIYTPSQAYINFVNKHSQKTFKGSLWGKTF